MTSYNLLQAAVVEVTIKSMQQKPEIPKTDINDIDINGTPITIKELLNYGITEKQIKNAQQNIENKQNVMEICQYIFTGKNYKGI